jgi:hypothetical protein
MLLWSGGGLQQLLAVVVQQTCHGDRLTLARYCLGRRRGPKGNHRGTELENAIDVVNKCVAYLS